MPDDSLLIQLSAFADGELDEQARREAELRLASDPELKRQLEVFKRLDRAASAVPVPQLARTGSASPVLAGAQQPAGLWGNIAERTVKVTDADLRTWRRLETAAQAAPELDASKYQSVWQAIAQRIAAEAPAVPERRFEAVWQGVQAGMQASRTKEASARVVRVDFAASRRRWRLTLAACAAVAAMVFGAFMLSVQPHAEDTLAMEIPEAAEDDDYQVHVKYVAGQDEPIVCFLPKTAENQPQPKGWRWLPY